MISMFQTVLLKEGFQCFRVTGLQGYNVTGLPDEGGVSCFMFHVSWFHGFMVSGLPAEGGVSGSMVSCFMVSKFQSFRPARRRRGFNVSGLQACPPKEGLQGYRIARRRKGSGLFQMIVKSIDFRISIIRRILLILTA